uniref:Putative ovule protein n=1 Tax=Solanum chacoense TaxID=4108 RepID=A0A0V0I184_SOLCH
MGLSMGPIVPHSLSHGSVRSCFIFQHFLICWKLMYPGSFRKEMLIEREIFGREALNVIACEGWERVERPETYKQWQARIMGARFTQIPFDREEFVNKAIQKVRLGYHRDFVIDEDSQWLLLGWKGRTIYALSCWKPV